jgi:hypothetical protein
VSLTLTWPHMLCGATTTVTSFPLSKHTGGGGTTPAFSSQSVYLQLRWDVGLPPSAVEFFSHSHFYKLSRSKVAGLVPPLLPSLVSCLFTVPWGFPSHPLQCSGPPPSLLRVFFVVIAYYSAVLFSLGGGRSVQGAMLILPRVVCGILCAA